MANIMSLMTTSKYRLRPGTIGFMVTPPIALTIAFVIQRDITDAFESTIVYFIVPYIISFPIFRLLPYQGFLASLAALVYALSIAWFGFWWGGLGVGTALALAVALPHSRDSARNSHS